MRVNPTLPSRQPGAAKVLTRAELIRTGKNFGQDFLYRLQFSSELRMLERNSADLITKKPRGYRKEDVSLEKRK